MRDPRPMQGCLTDDFYTWKKFKQMVINSSPLDLTWPAWLRGTRINDNVHEEIYVYEPITQLLHTEPIQRLNEVKQLGVVYRVFPNAVHSRFTHSLGVYHLAFRQVQHIRRHQPELAITDADHICVCIAALFHDSGHGPFSHTFERCLPNFSHEVMSTELVRKTLETSEIKQIMDKFLGTDEEYENNITFICELIKGGERFNASGRWLMKGRSPKYGFLYDIVNNSVDGHDVDKFDYLLRDKAVLNVDTAFGKNSLRRLISESRVMEDPKRKDYFRLARKNSVICEIENVWKARTELHRVSYQHPVVVVQEHLLLESIRKASRYLKYPDEKGDMIELWEIQSSPSAFLKTTDSILREILNSTSPELKESRELIQSLNSRKHPRRIATFPLTEAELDRMSSFFNNPLTSHNSTESIERKVKERIVAHLQCENFQSDKYDAEYFDKELIVKMLNYETKKNFERDPIENVLLYTDVSLKAYYPEEDMMRKPQSVSYTFCCYMRNGSTELKEFCEAVGAKVTHCMSKKQVHVRFQKKRVLEICSHTEERNNNQKRAKLVR